MINGHDQVFSRTWNPCNETSLSHPVNILALYKGLKRLPSGQPENSRLLVENFRPFWIEILQCSSIGSSKTSGDAAERLVNVLGICPIERKEWTISLAAPQVSTFPRYAKTERFIFSRKQLSINIIINFRIIDLLILFVKILCIVSNTWLAPVSCFSVIEKRDSKFGAACSSAQCTQVWENVQACLLFL